MRTLLFCALHPEYMIHAESWRSLQLLGHAEEDSLYRAGQPQPEIQNAVTRGRAQILEQYQTARRLALELDYDYLLTVESDMIVPPDLLDRLLACEADVAYSLYVFRRTRKLSAMLELQPGWAISLSETKAPGAIWGQQLEVAGVGLGATLISRRALELIDFRGIMGYSCDGFFSLDAQMAGLLQVCDTGCRAGHIDSQDVLWPDLDSPGLVRCERRADPAEI